MRGLVFRTLGFRRNIYFKLFFIVTVFICALALYTRTTSAEIFSWVQQDPTYVNELKHNAEPWNCEYSQNIEIDGQKDTLHKTCVTSGGSVRFGMTEYGVPLVSYGYDQKMYKLLGFCSGYKNCLYLPKTDTLISLQTKSTQIYRQLKVYKNFSANLEKRKSENGDYFEYIPRGYDASYIFTDSLANSVPVGWAYDSIGVSDNERWLVFEARGKGMMRLDLSNFNLLRFSSLRYSYETGPYPWTDYVVSDDGNQVIQMGSNTPIVSFDLSGGCGDFPNDQQIDDYTNIVNECPKRQLNEFLVTKIDQFKYGTMPEFTETNGGELRFYAVSGNIQNNAWVTLRAPNYQPTEPQLDYLALGDSYSSGEGDTELTTTGQKYYLAGTDEDGDYANGIPREKCHQSWRAYPFLLADYYGIPQDRFETVACSGAKIGDITGLSDYLGQARGGRSDGEKPRLEGLSNVNQLQTNALSDFNPGRVGQIEFVKKYKPKVVTIGISGNDVGFGGILVQCVLSPSQFTCDHASKVKSIANLGSVIKQKYNDLIYLYDKLHKVSPETKIYSIGYPEFIKTEGICGENVQLDENERIMTKNGVIYLNDAIKAASKNRGIKYIDIENSLYGARLCESPHPAVTGIAAWNKSENQESFHPNHLGNALIAETIKQQIGSESLLTYTHCPAQTQGDFCPDPNVTAPAPPTYFADAMVNNTTQSQNVTVTKTNITKQNQTTLSLDKYSLEPNTTANITLHSDPVNLGTKSADEDGSLSADIIVPTEVSAGYHTLVVSGKTYSGEPVEFTQIVLVTGENPNDLDENNIPDDQQSCGPFLESSGKDEDIDDIDDACDPIISDFQPYRARMGDISKNENPNHIYIERNTKATNYTGIQGDYDPDNDGWAIVAQSIKPKNYGKLADFWIDDNKNPHIKVQFQKHKKTKCRQFTPKYLKQVTDDKIRRLKLEKTTQGEC